MKKVAVIGGGITGLTAAFRLEQAGLNPLIFEAGKTAGGVIQSHLIQGYRVEAGPNSLQETPQLNQLVEELDLKRELVEANSAAKNRYIVRNGQLLPLPMSPPALLRSPLLSWKAKLRLLKEPYVRPIPGESTETLAAFTRRRLGTEVLDYIVNPFIAGIYAGDPERLSARHALPRFFAADKEHGSFFRAMIAAARERKEKPRLLSFRGGLGVLTAELSARLRKKIYLETTVEGITEREGRWELIATRYGRRLRDTYDAVILALPAAALAQIAFEREAGLSSLKILGEVQHSPVASVSLGFQRQQVAHPLDGFGMLIPEKERRDILGTLFASTLFPDRAPAGHVLLTSFVGGTRQPELTRNSESGLVKTVLEGLRPLLGVSGEPSFKFTHVWPSAIPQYEVGHDRFLQAIDNFESENPGLLVAGPVRDGVSVGQCIASGSRHADRVKAFVR